MAAKFDPYYRWLGIPPKDQPPNHYQLLGIERTETDPEVISNAADRQMAYVRSYQSGKRADEAQRLLNEIAAAKLCLLDAEKKAAYDAELAPAETSSVSTSSKSLPRAQSLPAAAPAGKPAGTLPPIRETPQVDTPQVETAQVETAQVETAQVETAARATSGSIAPLVLLLGGGALLLLLMLGGGVVLLARLWSGSDASTTVAVAPPAPPPRVDPLPSPIADPPVAPPPVPAPPVDPSPEEKVVTPIPKPPDDPPDDPPPKKKTADESPEEPDPLQLALESLLAAEPAAEDTRAPIPAESDKEERLEQVREIFPIDDARTFGQKIELTRRLLQTAGQTAEAVGKFVLLETAAQLAISAGDVRLAFSAIEQLDERFQVDGTQLRIDAVADAAEAAAPRSVRQQLVGQGIELVDQLFAEERYVDAGKLVAALTSVARGLRDREQLDALENRRARGRDLYASHKAWQAALETLREDPADVGALTIAGKYCVFMKGDWQRGLPLLAAGNDEQLKQLAEQEMAVPTGTDERRALADAWYRQAEQSQGLLGDRQKARAAMWYRQIENDVDGLARVEVLQRLEETRGLSVSGGAPYRQSQRAATRLLPVAHTGALDDAADLLVSLRRRAFLEGHSVKLSSVAFSDDGRYIAVGAEDGSVKIWDRTDNRVVQTLNSSEKKIHELRFSPDSTLLAAGSHDSHSALWDWRSGELLGRGNGGRVAFSADGKLLARIGDHLNKVTLYDTKTGDVASTLTGARRVAFSPDGKLLATKATGSSTVTLLYDLKNGGPPKELPSEAKTLEELCFSPDGKYLAAAWAANALEIWDVAAGELVATPVGQHGGYRYVHWPPAGRLIATGPGYGKYVRIRDARDGRLIQYFTPRLGNLRNVAFSPDGRQIAFAGEHERAAVYDIQVGVAPQIRTAKEIDLLPLVDVVQDSAVGVWRHTGKEIVSPRDFNARIRLPVIPPREYILDAEVSHNDDALDLNVGLIASGNQFAVTFEGYNGNTSISGLSNVDGKRPPDNETRKDGRFSRPGQRNHLRFEVRESVIRVTCNDETIIEWRGNQRRLQRLSASVGDPRILFLGSHGRVVTFHSLKLTPIIGEARLLRPASKSPSAKQAFDLASLPAGPTAAFTVGQPPSQLKLQPWDDGPFGTGTLGGKPVVRAGSSFLYFQVDDEFAGDVPADSDERVFLVATVLDHQGGGVDVQYDSHHGTYRTTERKRLTGSGEWVDLVFELPDATFTGRQNAGADFRLRTGGNRLVLHSVALRRVSER